MILDPCQSSVEKFAGVFNKVFTTQATVRSFVSLSLLIFGKNSVSLRFRSFGQGLPLQAIEYFSCSGVKL